MKDSHVRAEVAILTSISFWRLVSGSTELSQSVRVRLSIFRPACCRAPGRHWILGSFPNAVSTAELELFFSVSSQLIGKFF